MPRRAAIAQLGHRHTMYVESRVGAPSRFHDPNGRVVATAVLEREWDGLITLGSFTYKFTITDDGSSIRDRIGRRASSTSLDEITLLASDERSAGRFELVTTGPDRFGIYRRDHNLAVLNHAKIGNRVDMVSETSMPGFVGLLATLIVAFIPPPYRPAHA